MKRRINNMGTRKAQVIKNPFRASGYVVQIGENRYIADGHSSYAEYTTYAIAKADAESLGYCV